MSLRIGLDVDDCIANFHDGYIRRFGKFSEHDWCISRNVNHILIKERDFWLNLPVLRLPDFEPRLFCSARVNNKRWTKKYLTNLGLTSPLYQIPGYHLSKAKVLKGRVDVFIDDSLKNFIDLNLQGIPCLLMDSPCNQQWGPIGRVFSLKERDIEETYELFVDTVFKNFQQIVDEFRRN